MERRLDLTSSDCLLHVMLLLLLKPWGEVRCPNAKHGTAPLPLMNVCGGDSA